MPDKYIGQNPPAKQVCLLCNYTMPDHEGTIVIPEFADSSGDLSPLKFLCDGLISDRSSRHDFVNQAFRHYADEGVLRAAQELIFVPEMV